MQLNELNTDGIVTWIQLAHGPCHERCPCGYIVDKSDQFYEDYQYDSTMFYICENHSIYKCIKTLLNHKIKLNFKHELWWAKENDNIEIIELLKQYIINET